MAVIKFDNPTKKVNSKLCTFVEPIGVSLFRSSAYRLKSNASRCLIHTALSFSVMREAQRLWDEVATNPAVKSVVFTSAKESCFIAGADIFDISSVENKEELVPIIEEALMFFLKMKEKGVPMVAAINGPALGGGLEWGKL